MSCCEYKCEQGRDCPIRKQRMEATNRAYAERGMVVDSDPYADTFGTFKALISVITVCVIVTLIFFFWGK
jgi:hypothetical protein